MALTQAQKRLLEAARGAAKELGKSGNYRGRELSSLIGELAACEIVDLMWEPSDGYDASSREGRVQIKTRKSWSTPQVNRAGRMGRFGREKGYLFDTAIYVELDDNFNVSGIWRMPVDEIKLLEKKEKGNRGLHVGTFVTEAEPVFVL